MSKLHSPSLKSVFAKDIIDFIEYKKSLGYKYITETYVLFRFDNFCSNQNLSERDLSESVVSNWINENMDNSYNTIMMRKRLIKLFALYLHNHGVTAYLPDIPKSNRSYTEFVPYIFTQQQVNTLLQMSLKAFNPWGKSSMHLSFPLIMHLLCCTGMRISEVLNIRIKDFDLGAGIIYIKQSKFDKSRLVPVSSSVNKLANSYFETVHSMSTDEDWFFQNLYGDKNVTGTIYSNFRRLLVLCNISHSSKGPRLHDLRHTFAVHSLKKLIKTGKDIYVSLPILSEYLGHSNIYATERYLHLTAEMYPELSEKTNKLIREVKFDETY